jgi:hypothetical protein
MPHLRGIWLQPRPALVIEVHGKILSVDKDKKLVTLQADDGKQVTVHVYNPYNLAAAKPEGPFVAPSNSTIRLVTCRATPIMTRMAAAVDHRTTPAVQKQEQRRLE